MKRNKYWIIAGIINIFTAILHLIGGQLDLINPFMESNTDLQIKTELLGVWHMVTIMLFASSILYFKYGFSITKKVDIALVSFISYLYIAFSFAFILSSVYKSVLAPQWVLLLPIGLLGIIGAKKLKTNA
ncbi:hypothetical protein ATE84_0961 [Aquimarina sp. MAR_2010_214]|uniref:hypothetical protein n=1 Tax=Aquimarina sp. MAR_2010_214 TaxID=1250026 RepID=UPI000C6FF0CA|nr:hypothetical protein [Aquimarina sp. MAR_2010_214]PKV48945.1 hypothetical protein ATE84_0961 [Aquimarina sp. MAR_2010_214]